MNEMRLLGARVRRDKEAIRRYSRMTLAWSLNTDMPIVTDKLWSTSKKGQSKARITLDDSDLLRLDKGSIKCKDIVIQRIPKFMRNSRQGDIMDSYYVYRILTTASMISSWTLTDKESMGMKEIGFDTEMGITPFNLSKGFKNYLSYGGVFSKHDKMGNGLVLARPLREISVINATCRKMIDGGYKGVFIAPCWEDADYFKELRSYYRDLIVEFKMKIENTHVESYDMMIWYIGLGAATVERIRDVFICL